MTDHVASALFVYTEKTAGLIEPIQQNAFGTVVTPVAYEALVEKPESLLAGVGHVVAAGSLEVLKAVFQLSLKYDFSVGILPLETQKELISIYRLPQKVSEAVDLALRSEPAAMDLVLCNGKIMLFKATVGGAMQLEKRAGASRLKFVALALQRLLKLRLSGISFQAAGGAH